MIDNAKMLPTMVSATGVGISTCSGIPNATALSLESNIFVPTKIRMADKP